ncbi:MAG TPA: flagellar hook-basal body protein [Bacillota bacterium]|nr:flagellar hook-basal body protein [Bacillota bacterium]
MLRGFYTAASGMISQQRQQEALANNIANANTPGYKADQTTLRAFPEMLLQQVGALNHVPTENGLNIRQTNEVGPLNTGVYAQEMVPNHVQGDMRETQIPTDVALMNGNMPDENGSLFFTVQNGAGDIRYTRNGNFTVDQEGFLVTNDGYYVLDSNGNQINTDGVEFNVTQNGVVQTVAGDFPLGISYVENTDELVKEGTDLFAGEGVPVPGDVTFEVAQGFLERSNVDAGRTMTEMMEAYRVFEMNQRVLRAYDESMEKAVTEIGRIG